MLAIPPKGNLSFVRDHLIKYYEDDMTNHALRAGALDAEIGAGEGGWFLVYSFPLEDMRALRSLARRRFGAFRPMEQRRDKATGAMLQGWQPIIATWILVYAFDMERMHGRILACPGVAGILCAPVTGKAVAIPDSWVHGLRERSFDDHVHAKSNVEYQAERHIKRLHTRPTKKQRKELDRLKKQAKDCGIGWDQSTWERINTLAPHERIAHLQRTLVLPAKG